MRRELPSGEVGRCSYIGGGAQLRLPQHGNFVIGAFCSIGDGLTVHMSNGNHRPEWVTAFPFGHKNKEIFGKLPDYNKTSTVVIGSDVWIGSGVTLMPGVTIGDGAIVAANSHVVKDVPRYCVAGGNPAKVIKQRFDDETIDLLMQLTWWQLPNETIKQILPILMQEPDKDALRELIKVYR